MGGDAGGNDAQADAVAALVATTPGLFYWGDNYAAGVWSDRSGNGRDSSAADAGDQPTLTTDNGASALKFDKAEATGTVGQALIVPASLLSGTVSKVTLFAAVRRYATGANMDVFCASNTNFLLRFVNTNALRVYVASGSNFVTGPSIGTDTNPHLICATFDGTNGTPANRVQIYQDDMVNAVAGTMSGTVGASFGSIAAINIGRNTGGGTPADIYGSAFLVYPGSVLDVTQRGNVKTQLQTLLPWIT
jgi:hypothetical protein